MTQLSFEVIDARAEKFAASPTIIYRLRVQELTGEPVHALALQCQLRIEPQRRRYTSSEEDGLVDLFGPVERWGTALKPFLWTHQTVTVSAFETSTEFDLPIECTYDLEVAASRYFEALEGNEIAVLLLFSGTIFSRGQTGYSVARVPWDLECSHRLPVSVWREAIDSHFPNAGWLRLHRDTIAELLRFRSARGLPSVDMAVEALLREARVEQRPAGQAHGLDEARS